MLMRKKVLSHDGHNSSQLQHSVIAMHRGRAICKQSEVGRRLQAYPYNRSSVSATLARNSELNHR